MLLWYCLAFIDLKVELACLNGSEQKSHSSSHQIINVVAHEEVQKRQEDLSTVLATWRAEQSRNVLYVPTGYLKLYDICSAESISLI